MFKPKAINRKKLVAFVLPIIQKGAWSHEWKTGKTEPPESRSREKADCRPAQREAAGAWAETPDTEWENPPVCTRAGMLEKFLREPTLLTDDDVMELLTFLFHGEAAQKKLDTLIEERRKMLTTDGSENPLF